MSIHESRWGKYSAPTGDVALAVLSGELDLAGVERLLGVLDPIVAEGRSTLIDMEALRFIVPLGWRSLFALGWHWRPKQASPDRRPNSAVRRVLEIAGLHGIISIFDTKD